MIRKIKFLLTYILILCILTACGASMSILKYGDAEHIIGYNGLECY